MTVLLCDVGGTHIRFALASDDPIQPHKARVDQYPHLQDAMSVFLLGRSILPQDVTAFYLAFSNRNEWNTDPELLKALLPNAVMRQVNDFEANAYGITGASPSDFMSLNDVTDKNREDVSKAVIGVGTGLGLAYICGGKGREFIQRTHGGHMLPAASSIHQELYDFASRGKQDVLIYEDMLSGRGIYKIYAYLSDKNHLDLEYADAENLMRDGKDNPVFQEALVLFFEMLGLFAHHAVAFGYAYGGIYLTGGVIDRLMIAGLFKKEAFMKYFIQKNVPIVTADVELVPIYWVKDEFVSLKGLRQLSREDQSHA